MNLQPIEKTVLSSDGTLDLHSLFYTIQGEGPFAGKPAIFIRLAGCNLQCPGCDTDYTSTRKRTSVALLLAALEELRDDEYPDAPNPLVVITGGEPFRQNITPLCVSLIQKGYSVQVETNGTLPPGPGFPFEVSIVCSPKTGKINDGIAARLSALKYVVKADAVLHGDGLPSRSLEHSCSPSVAKPPSDFKGTIYIQPMDESNAYHNKRNLMTAMDSCLKHGHTLQVQIHKIIGVE